MNRYGAIALVLFATFGAVVLYFHFKPAPAAPGIHLPATPAPELKREETIPVLVFEPVQVYKPAVKQKLKLPPAVQADANQHVVASTRTPNDERPHTVTTVLDTSTGKFETYDRAEPLPWLAVSTKSQVGLFYGLKRGDPVIRLQGQQELLQIKAVRIGATATLDGDGETFVGVGAWARW
jgi:hypothetical protein